MVEISVKYPNKTMQNSSESQGDNQVAPASINITYNDIATKLLQDKLLLTALELHTELIESGREIRELKEFFSNPANFEQTRLEDLTPIRKF